MEFYLKTMSAADSRDLLAFMRSVIYKVF